MKKYLILFFIFFTVSESVSQNSPFISNYRYGTVTFTNGDTLNGYIVRKNNLDIKFKKSENSKEKSKYKSENIKSLTIDYQTYIYKRVKNKSNEIKPLQVYIAGDVVLYRELIKRRNMGRGIAGTNSSISVDAKESEIHYYLSKKQQSDVTYLRFGNSYSKKFLKIAKEYFGDCTSLINKIENWEFERFDIPGIVNYYNNDCSK